MNLLGKIFTGLILVVALVVMVASVFVYATHRNWKEDADALKSQLDQAQARNDQLQSSLRSLESQLQAELEASLQEVSKLESERVELMSQNSLIQQELDQLRQQERTSVAAVASTQANNEELTDEVGQLRQEIRQNQSARDQAFATTVDATDELHQARGTLTSLRERNMQLAQQLSETVSLLKENDIDPSTDPDALVPRVRGLVSATHHSAGSQLIEVSIGADDGLKPGHTVEVFRGDRYLGRAEILRTDPDRAVGRIIRQFQQGQIQEGDHVATRFRVG